MRMDEKNQETPPIVDTPQESPSTAQDETDAYKDKYLRLLAEIDNTRKRMQKEKHEMTRFTVENLLCDLLGPIDNLENALKFTKGMSSEVQNWAQGFHMILEQFKEVLSQQGVTPFISEGALFDPSCHHAIETEETQNVPEGTIIQEFVKGYASKERTLRPARVKVAMAPKEENLS